MISIVISGNKTLSLEHLVLDFNGTLAIDGSMIKGVKERLNMLAKKIKVYVITADTFGKASENVKGINCELKILEGDNQQKQKVDFISQLGKESVVAIGNGLNDKVMLKQAALGIVVIQTEGAAVNTLQSADIVCVSINDALDLLMNPLRLNATLRN